MTIREDFISKLKQKKDRYEMHKYWGKKPANNLNLLIEKYSNIGDIVLDPFCGYGVFCSEAYILQRNVVLNDLNPIANYIEEQLLEKDIDLIKLENEFNIIKDEMIKFSSIWYTIEINNKKCNIISTLRDENDKVIKCKYTSGSSKRFIEHTFTDNEKKEFELLENSYIIDDWYPVDKLIENSRISAKKDMVVSDLFTKRALANHSKLLTLINTYSSGNELKLLLMAFTSNLANCSKLVPPTTSRGEMSQGAWMTGFYIAKRYIENNVLHYFENRVKKAIKGKKDYLDSFNTLFLNNFDLREVKTIKEFNKKTFGYYLLNEDTKNLSLEDNSIDYIFTDPPYGDSVPYFEQSIIWNSWLKKVPNYNDEIIISDSKKRTKNIDEYSDDMNSAIFEIFRVLKKDKFFSITFHSLSGLEWRAISNACLKVGFELDSFEWLVQKTFTPRQLNRAKTVKGDVLITFKKPLKTVEAIDINEANFSKIIIDKIDELIKDEKNTTNIIFMELIELIFNRRVLIPKIDIFNLLNKNFDFNDDKWSKL